MSKSYVGKSYVVNFQNRILKNLEISKSYVVKSQNRMYENRM